MTVQSLTLRDIVISGSVLAVLTFSSLTLSDVIFPDIVSSDPA